MGVVIDMPVAMVQQVNECAERSGCSFRDLLCLSVEMYLAEQERKLTGMMTSCTALLHIGSHVLIFVYP